MIDLIKLLLLLFALIIIASAFVGRNYYLTQGEKEPEDEPKDANDDKVLSFTSRWGHYMMKGLAIIWSKILIFKATPAADKEEQDSEESDK